MTKYTYACFIYVRRDLIYREEHIQKKIDGMIVEAKAKMGKGDKKGELQQGVCCFE